MTTIYRLTGNFPGYEYIYQDIDQKWYRVEEAFLPPYVDPYENDVVNMIAGGPTTGMPDGAAYAMHHPEITSWFSGMLNSLPPEKARNEKERRILEAIKYVLSY